jgi:hypothetical protein
VQNLHGNTYLLLYKDISLSGVVVKRLHSNTYLLMVEKIPIVRGGSAKVAQQHLQSVRMRGRNSLSGVGADIAQQHSQSVG